MVQYGHSSSTVAWLHRPLHCLLFGQCSTPNSRVLLRPSIKKSSGTFIQRLSQDHNCLRRPSETGVLRNMYILQYIILYTWVTLKGLWCPKKNPQNNFKKSISRQSESGQCRRHGLQCMTCRRSHNLRYSGMRIDGSEKERVSICFHNYTTSPSFGRLHLEMVLKSFLLVVLTLNE